jgi:hypothetical protein
MMRADLGKLIGMFSIALNSKLWIPVRSTPPWELTFRLLRQASRHWLYNLKGTVSHLKSYIVISASPQHMREEHKAPKGWPSRPPFEKPFVEKFSKSRVFWSELSLTEKNAYLKTFIKEYIREVKKCLPYVWRLFLMIYRISTWRTLMIFPISIIKGLLPAVNLETRRDFIILVENI